MESKTPSIQSSLTLDELWRWLGFHYNCILRAGGPGFVLYDQPDLHWHLTADPDGLLVVQLVRGKDTTAEFFMNPAEILYVTSTIEEEDHALFELHGHPDTDDLPLYHFLLAHPYEEEEPARQRRLTH